jgi:hypothetical protein
MRRLPDDFIADLEPPLPPISPIRIRFVNPASAAVLRGGAPSANRSSTGWLRQGRSSTSAARTAICSYLEDYVRGLLARVVAPGGRLILGAYGSRTRNVPAFDVAAFMRAAGLAVAGQTTVGSVPEAQFAWTDAAAE